MTILTIITNKSNHTVFFQKSYREFSIHQARQLFSLQFLDKSQGKWHNNFN